MMRILFISERYHPYVGGVETQLRLVAKSMQARGHDVSVVTMRFSKDALPSRLRVLSDSLLVPRAQSYDDDGIPVHAVSPTPADRLRMLPAVARALPGAGRWFHPLRRFGYHAFGRVYVPKLKAHMQDVDVVHTVSATYLGWAARDAAYELGLPFFCTPYVHPGAYGDDPDSVAFYNRCTGIFALIETDRELLLGLGVDPGRVHISGVVPLLPDRADPDAFRRRHGLEGTPVIQFVGNMVPYKGVLALTEAAPLVWQHKPEAHFLFAGPASEEVQAAFAEMDPRIRYLGKVPEQEKADALAACDVFAMPSQFEILPAVYLEAWSYARPVIAGTANGLRELVEGNDAGVIATQKPADLAAQIVRLLDDPPARTRMGRNGQAFVQRRYSEDALVSRLLDTYTASLNPVSVEHAP